MRKINLSNNQLYVSAWIIFSIILFYIGSDRLINAHLWAEDGKFFLEYALLYGLPAILQEYSGYYHILPHIFVQISANTLPIYLIPSAICAVAYLIYAAVVAQLVRSEYRIYIASDLARFVIALMFCLWIPGRQEILGNMANLHWVLFLYLWLVGMRPVAYPIQWWEILLIIVSIFSTGEAILITPLLFLRIFFTWLENKNYSYIFSKRKAEIIILSILFINVILNLLNTSKLIASLPSQQSFSWLYFFDGFQKIFLSSIFIYPWLNLNNYQYYHQILGQFYYLIILFIMIATLLYLLLSRFQQKDIHMLIGLSCLFALPILTWLVRPQSLAYVTHNIMLPEWWGTRYTFVFGIIGLLAWSVFLYRVFSYTGKKIGSNKLGSAVILLFFAIYGYQHLSTTKIDAYGHQYSWQESAALLERSLTSGCPKQVVVPIYPDGWKLTYTSPESKLCSEKL